jgi:hypothetical protein
MVVGLSQNYTVCDTNDSDVPRAALLGVQWWAVREGELA